MPRISAGGVSTSVCIACNAHGRVMEAGNSITLTVYTSVNILNFIALGWRSENDYGLNTKYAQCTFPAPGCAYNCTVILSTFMIKLLSNASQL